LGGDRAGGFRLFFWSKNHLHFYCQNLQKTMVLGDQNGSKNRLFSLFLRASFRGHFWTRFLSKSGSISKGPTLNPLAMAQSKRMSGLFVESVRIVHILMKKNLQKWFKNH